MKPRQTILLTPYRLPTESTLYLGDEEVAAFLNGWRALWHPAALACAESLPRLASPYDHEDPSDGLLIGIPDNPPLMLADDWRDRAKSAGAVVFTATADWGQTLANLREALLAAEPGDEHLPRLCELPEEQAAPFYGLGFGTIQLTALFEAMQQDDSVASSDMVEDLAAAIGALAEGNQDLAAEKLRSAAERLLSAREIVYPVSVHVIDLYLPEGAAPWPAAFDEGQAVNVLACGQQLEKLARERPEQMAQLRERVSSGLAEVVGGPYREREDVLLPLESQLANLRLGVSVTEELTGAELKVYGRVRGGLHAQTPLMLQSMGLSRCLMVPFDDSLVPSHTATIVSWPSHDGKQVDAFTRVPQPAESAQTYFNVAHHLHQTIMQDQTATLALMHRAGPAPLWYRDWLALTRLAPVLGKWTTLSAYFEEVTTGDYTAAASPDDFAVDYLSQRVPTTPTAGEDQGDGTSPSTQAHQWADAHRSPSSPVSEFVALSRVRREVDAAWTFAAILRSLRGELPDLDGKPFAQRLSEVEAAFERGEGADANTALKAASEALARRLVARGPANSPGWLVLNPCAFARRVVVELPDCPGPVAVAGQVKASQLDGSLGRAVVEVPALGFAWVPRPAGPGPQPAARIKMADERCVRNEHLEAEIDPVTGGLKALRDVRTRTGRLGQQLVYNPGGKMKATSVRVLSAGPALGEIVTEGELFNEDEKPVARYKQHLQVWMGRPVLEMRIELEPLVSLSGYPWHEYFGSRFAWRDESTPLLRGYAGMTALTAATRPESGEFLSLYYGGRSNTVLLPGGLPFHQRHGTRMLDTVLITEGETARSFELAIALDREQPAQTALGIISPAPAVLCQQGPPHIGPSGWLFHLDAPNVLLSSLRPAEGDGVVATLLELVGHGGQAALRCVRNPARARMVGLRGDERGDLAVEGDAVTIDIGPNDLVLARAEFS
jgi:alpha-mannosidase